MLSKRYIIPVFIGAIGMIFYTTIAVFEDIHFLLHIAIMIISLLLLAHGYQIIENNYERKKARRMRLIIAGAVVVAILISGGVAIFYGPFIAFVVGLLGVIVLILSLLKIYN